MKTISARVWRALLALPVCVLLWWLPAGSAQAAINCTASMDAVSFGTVNLVAGTPAPVNATLNYTCTNNGLLPEQVRVCFNIGDGNEGVGNFTPRVMKSPAGNILKFQLYQGTSSTVWGSNGNTFAPSPFTDTLSVPALLVVLPGSVTRSTTLRGELMPLQSTVPPGSYQDVFTAGHTSISFSSSTLSTPANCSGTTVAGFPFTVSATVAKSCQVTAQALNFGTVAGASGAVNRDAASTITVTCTSPTSYTVGLSPSNNATNGAGVMVPTGGVPGNTDTVAYQLYRDAGRTLAWGSSVGTNTAAAIGTGAAQPLTVFGRVPGASVNVRPDSYRDIVTVTVAY